MSKKIIVFVIVVLIILSVIIFFSNKSKQISNNYEINNDDFKIEENGQGEFIIYDANGVEINRTQDRGMVEVYKKDPLYNPNPSGDFE